MTNAIHKESWRDFFHIRMCSTAVWALIVTIFGECKTGINWAFNMISTGRDRNNKPRRLVILYGFWTARFE